MSKKILVFAGSTRVESFNKKLALLADKSAKEAGAETTYVDLKDYPMPIYDGDLENEKGLPENAKKLKEQMINHQGFIISCPEYNSSISAVLKNTIDWISRPVPDEPSLIAFKEKVVLLLSTSPGRLGGLRGLVPVRSILSNIGAIVLPDQLAVSGCFKAFNDSGELVDEKQQKILSDYTQKLVETTSKLS